MGTSALPLQVTGHTSLTGSLFPLPIRTDVPELVCQVTDISVAKCSAQSRLMLAFSLASTRKKSASLLAREKREHRSSHGSRCNPDETAPVSQGVLQIKSVAVTITSPDQRKHGL